MVVYIYHLICHRQQVIEPACVEETCKNFRPDQNPGEPRTGSRLPYLIRGILLA
jgi:hypothetical protein